MTNKEKKNEPVTFSIFPNARGFGYAVMQKAFDVIDSQIITIRPISNQSTLKRIKEIIDYYEPEIIILEDFKGIGSRKSSRVEKLIVSIGKYAESKKLKVRSYSRADIRFAFSNFNAHTKHEIATVISENIPVLKSRLMDKRKIDETEKYTAGVFDAVSLGITHFYLNK